MVERSFLFGFRILALLLMLVSGTVGEARDIDLAHYPEKTITVFCPWASGGGTDQVSRFIADQLQQRLGSPVIVVNREGGSGAVGHEAIADADPDGYTLGMITAELSTMKNMGICQKTYRDYECLMQVNADAAAIIVRREAPWKNLAELLDEIRKRPGELKMSGTATGGLWDLARAGMLDAAGLKPSSVIWVPTKGSAPSVVQLLGGHIDVVCCSVPEVAAQLEAKELRVLAVLSEGRLPEFPELPTAKEQGLDWVAMGWRGLALPKGTPALIVQKLEQHLTEIVTSEDYLHFMEKLGYGVAVKGPEDFEAFLDRQETQWKKVLLAAGYMGSNADPGPYALPIALGLVLGIGVLFQVGAWWMGKTQSRESLSVTESPAEETKPHNLNAVVILVSLAAYLMVLPWAGFSLATAVFASGLIWRFGSRWWSALFSGVLLTAAVWLLFVLVFKVPLPEGELGLPF